MALRGFSDGELVAEAVEKCRLIEETAMKSGNLKGTAVRDFKQASRFTEASLKELGSRRAAAAASATTSASTDTSRERDSTTEMWAKLGRENRELHKEIPDSHTEQQRGTKVTGAAKAPAHGPAAEERGKGEEGGRRRKRRRRGKQQHPPPQPPPPPHPRWLRPGCWP